MCVWGWLEGRLSEWEREERTSDFADVITHSFSDQGLSKHVRKGHRKGENDSSANTPNAPERKMMERGTDQEANPEHLYLH